MSLVIKPVTQLVQPVYSIREIWNENVPFIFLGMWWEEVFFFFTFHMLIERRVQKEDNIYGWIMAFY